MLFNAIIRPALCSDLAALVKLEQRCFTAEAYEAEQFQDHLDKSTEDPGAPFFLAFADTGAAEQDASTDPEKLIGYCMGEMLAKGGGEIIGLAVRSECRGLGLGRDLLNKVCDILRGGGARHIELQVRCENTAAIHLYKSENFIETALLPDYYEPGDALRMKRTYKKIVAASARRPAGGNL